MCADLFSIVDKNKPSAPLSQIDSIPKIADRLAEELVIAFVGPVGSGCTTTYKVVEDILKEQYGYTCYYYKLSDYIVENAALVKETIPQDINKVDKITLLQKIGDSLREKISYNYLAGKAIEKIAKRRDSVGFDKTIGGNAVPKKLRDVHLIDSVKNTEEADLLRQTYGDIFILIGVFAPKDIRVNRLIGDDKDSKIKIEGIIEKDYSEGEDHGQQVRDVFHQADFFVRNDQDNDDKLRIELKRFLEILFGVPVHTPTIDESTMYVAFAEAARSACLSRRVGAAIISESGELLGLGRNDVPCFNGGLYLENTIHGDNRCYKWKGKECYNDKKKNDLYRQVYRHLIESKLLINESSEDKVIKALKTTDLKSIIEYSRSVHAEMDAITSVARGNKGSIRRGILYTTTYPCHSCARHIVASGIIKVYYIEPYPKSLALELHSDTISERETDIGKKVLFLQYSGVAPKNILKYFSSPLTRKEKDGKICTIDKKKARPVVSVSMDDYATHEKYVVTELAKNEEKIKP